MTAVVSLERPWGTVQYPCLMCRQLFAKYVDDHETYRDKCCPQCQKDVLTIGIMVRRLQVRFLRLRQHSVKVLGPVDWRTLQPRDRGIVKVVNDHPVPFSERDGSNLFYFRKPLRFACWDDFRRYLKTETAERERLVPKNGQTY